MKLFFISRRVGARSPAAAAAILGAVAALASCGTATPLRYYTVEGAPSGRPTVDYRGPAVAVHDVRIPASMDRTDVVQDRGGGEVQLREFDRWAAPLAREARQALVQNLAVRLPPGKVVFPGAGRADERVVLDIDVLSMRIADGEASMWVAWGADRPLSEAPASAREARGGAPRPGMQELRLRAPAGDDAADVAKAWSALLGQLADRIALTLAAAP